jgi:ferredoxin
MNKPCYLSHQAIALLFEQLGSICERIVGPTMKAGAIVYQELDSPAQLPQGYQDQTEAGVYRLQQTDSQRCFDWVSTAQGIKPWVYLPEQPLWTFQADQSDTDKPCSGFTPCDSNAADTAIIGARACDLAALKLLDQHFLEGEHVDPHYQAQRDSLFIVAVNCHRSLDTCFCVSTGDGPEVSFGHDLVLDELDDGFVVNSGSQRGADLLQSMQLPQATVAQSEAAQKLRQGAKQQKRAIPTKEQLSGLIQAEADESRWEEVASRCLSCGNCTAVCPTCFCFRNHDETSLDGNVTTHLRQWDSCFSDGHGHLAGTQIRNHPEHKYRQWLMHKLVYWHEQYGRSGCSGCGRCITWCPAAIDLVAEAEKLSSPAEGSDD